MTKPGKEVRLSMFEKLITPEFCEPTEKRLKVEQTLPEPGSSSRSSIKSSLQNGITFSK